MNVVYIDNVQKIMDKKVQTDTIIGAIDNSIQNRISVFLKKSIAKNNRRCM